MLIRGKTKFPWGETYENVVVEPGRYFRSQQIALQIFAEDGEPLSKPTVNLEANGLYPTESNMTFIGDYGEHEGMLGVLEDMGVVKYTGRTVKIGPFGAPAHEVYVDDDLISADG